MSISELLLRLIIAFFTLLLLARLMGRKEISQMTFFNFVSAISIGTIGASLAIDETISIRNGVIALLAWSIITIILAVLNIKSKQIRKIIVGEPVLLINNGEIVQASLREARLDVDSLHALLRKKNVFSTSDVNYAFFETDGTLSVLKKTNQLPITKIDMELKPSMEEIYPIPFPIISDGQYYEENIKKYNVDKSVVQSQLKAMGVKRIADVFYAECQKDGSIYMAKARK